MCACVLLWVGASVNICLSLDDSIWLHLKAISILDVHSVGQDPGAIYYIRWRHVQSAAREDSETWPYLMKAGPHACWAILQDGTVKIDHDTNADLRRKKKQKSVVSESSSFHAKRGPVNPNLVLRHFDVWRKREKVQTISYDIKLSSFYCQRIRCMGVEWRVGIYVKTSQRMVVVKTIWP